MKRWSVPIVLGSLAGSLAAARMDARILAAVFGCVALAAALKMLLPLDHVVLRRSVPGGLGGAVIPVVIGAVSAMMGIGGGTLSVPTMTLCGEPVHKAVGTAALTGLWISVPATAGFLLAPAPDAFGTAAHPRVREPARFRHHRPGLLGHRTPRRTPRALARSPQAVRVVRGLPDPGGCPHALPGVCLIRPCTVARAKPSLPRPAARVLEAVGTQEEDTR